MTTTTTNDHWTSTPPTEPGMYVWRREPFDDYDSIFGPAHFLVSVAPNRFGSLFACVADTGACWNPLSEYVGGQWRRLEFADLMVPKEEVEKAYKEGFHHGLSNAEMGERIYGYETSRTRRVMEGDKV